MDTLSASLARLENFNFSNYWKPDTPSSYLEPLMSFDTVQNEYITELDSDQLKRFAEEQNIRTDIGDEELRGVLMKLKKGEMIDEDFYRPSTINKVKKYILYDWYKPGNRKSSFICMFASMGWLLFFLF